MEGKLPSETGPVCSGPWTILRLVALCFLFMFSFENSYSQRQLIKDVNTEMMPGFIPYTDLKAASARIFFAKGTELWVSEGYPTTTKLVRKFNSLGPITMVANIAYFSASDGNTGAELWKSSGVPEGTVRVKDIYPGVGGSDPQNITMHSLSLIYFTAYTATHGRELWKTNGTDAGTVMVKDILQVKGNSNPSQLTKVGSLLYFTANAGQLGIELWKTNGTAAGTVMVKDIQSTPGGSSNPRHLTNVNGTLYFAALHAGMGYELFKTNGTAAGTVVVKDISPEGKNSDIDNLIDVNGTLFFTANDQIHGDELWKSDGTEAGTVIVKDLNPGPGGSNSTNGWNEPGMNDFANMNGILFYRAGKGSNDEFYVRSDGTEAGTYRIASAGAFGLNPFQPNFTYINGFVYYVDIDHSTNGNLGVNRLYRIKLDGSARTIIRTFDVPIDYYDNFEQMMVRYGSNVVLTAITNNQWSVVIQSVVNSTYYVLDQGNTPTASSVPGNFVEDDGRMYFTTANEYPADYYGLHSTDGTESGTYELARIEYDTRIVKSGSTVYFNSTNFLYKIVAPDAIQQVFSSENYSHPIAGLTDVNGTLYFHNSAGELWKTNGTTEGTVKVRALHNIRSISNVGGKAFVLNQTPTGGLELWRTNATGLLRVKTIRAAHATPAYHNLTQGVGSVFYFTANDGTHGHELWRSDGTEFGTFMVKDLNTIDSLMWDAYESDIRSFAVFNNKLYFSAADENNRWKYYYVSGRNSVAEVGALPPVIDAVPYGGKLYLFAQKTVTDVTIRLWSTSGVAGNLTLEQELGYGSISHAFVNGNLYFHKEADELKQITSCGIVSIPDVGANLYGIAAFGDHLIYGGYDYQVGIEPYIYYNLPDMSSSCGAETARAAEEENIFTPWPNPYTEDFTMRISGNEGEEADVVVYNASGFPIANFSRVSANTDYTHIGSNWPKGMYVVKVRKRDRVMAYRIMKK